MKEGEPKKEEKKEGEPKMEDNGQSMEPIEMEQFKGASSREDIVWAGKTTYEVIKALITPDYLIAIQGIVNLKSE
jgi:hypothetical protein